MKPARRLARTAARVTVAAVLAPVMFLAVAVQSVQAQVLQQVPSDALVVIKFNKLKPTSDKIAAFATKLGLAQMQPAFANPLAEFQKQSGISQGLDPNGEAAVVIVNGPMNEKEPPAMLILPVTDYAAFLKNFPGAKQEDQVSVVKMKGESQDTFVVKRGNYAVLAPKRQYVDAKAGAGLAPAGLAGKEVASKDIVAFVNMKTARTRILPELKKNRAKIVSGFEKGFRDAGGPPRGPRRAGQQAPAAAPANPERDKYLPLIRAAANRVLDVAEQAITDADAATYGWTFGDAGLQATGLIEFTPNSPAAGRVAQFKNSDAGLTPGLPQTKYWFFGGSAGDNSAAGQQLFNDFIAPIEKEFAGLGAEGKPLQDYLTAARAYFGSLKGQSFGWVAPSGMIGQEAIVQVVSVQRGDAPKLLDAAKRMFDSQQALMGLFGGPMGQQQMKSTYTPKAKTVDGVQFDVAQTTFAPPAPGQPRTPQQMQAQQMMTWMHGPGGMSTYQAAVGADKLVAAVGANDALLKQVVASAKADQDLLGALPPVKATAAQLPQQRIGGWYVQIDQIATSIAGYAKAFGMPINFQVPQNLASLGATVSTEGSAVRIDGYAPAQTLQSVIAAVMQTYMQMQGGMQPGGPGAGPGGL